MTKIFKDTNKEESAELTEEQEKEYLIMQEELLVPVENVLCEDATCQIEKVQTPDTVLSWLDITDRFSRFSVRAKKSGRVTLSGTTWPTQAVMLTVIDAGKVIFTQSVTTDTSGVFVTDWLPKV